MDNSSARDRLKLVKDDLKNWKKHPAKANPPVNTRQSKKKQAKATEESTKQRASEAGSTEEQSRQDRQAEVTQEPANQQASEADSTTKQSLPSKKVSDAVQ